MGRGDITILNKGQDMFFIFERLSCILSRECIVARAKCKLGRLSKPLEQCGINIGEVPMVWTVVDNGIRDLVNIMEVS